MSGDVRPSWRFMLSHPAHIVSLGLGTGLVPKAPGTVGTLLGFPLFAALQFLPPVERALAYLALIALGTLCCSITERALGRGDPGCVVFDEIVAMSLVLEFAPATWPYWIAGFAAFRFFDIAKPWPIGLADRAPWAGFAIMLDDLVAAAAAIGVILAVARLAAMVGF